MINDYTVHKFSIRCRQMVISCLCQQVRSGLRTIPCAPEEEARVEASDLLPDEGASAPLDPDPSRLIGSLRMTLVIAEERKREGASRVSEE